MRRGDFKKAELLCLLQSLHGIGKADAARGNSLLFLNSLADIENAVPFICREIICQSDVPFFDPYMILIRKPWEDHPPGTVFDKAFGGMLRIFGRILYHDGSISVADSGGWTEENGRAVFFRICKCLLYHLICFLGGSRIKAGELGECGVMSGILLCLGRDRSGIIRDKDHHSSFDAYICKAHQWVGSYVKPDLFHGYETARACIGCPCGNLQGSFLIDGPFDVGLPGPAPRCRFQNLGRRGSRITGYQVHS